MHQFNHIFFDYRKVLKTIRSFYTYITPTAASYNSMSIELELIILINIGP